MARGEADGYKPVRVPRPTFSMTPSGFYILLYLFAQNSWLGTVIRESKGHWDPFANKIRQYLRENTGDCVSITNWFNQRLADIQSNTLPYIVHIHKECLMAIWLHFVSVYESYCPVSCYPAVDKFILPPSPTELQLRETLYNWKTFEELGYKNRFAGVISLDSKKIIARFSKNMLKKRTLGLKDEFDEHFNSRKMRKAAKVTKTNYVLPYPGSTEVKMADTKYICCESPEQQSVNNFWTMILIQKTKAIIIMDYEDNDGYSFYPVIAKKKLEIGELKIICLTSSVTEVVTSSTTLIERKLRIEHPNEQFELVMYQWIGWVEGRAPILDLCMIDLHEKTKKLPGPVTLVSTVGRGCLGTVILANAIRESIESGKVPIPVDIVRLMKNELSCLVENAFQYVYAVKVVCLYYVSNNLVDETLVDED